jgi:hypothetical protein
MAVWFTRWSRCAGPAQTADGISMLRPKHQQLIVETTCCAREAVRLRCTTEAL